MKHTLLALVLVGLLWFAGIANAQPYDTQGQPVGDEESDVRTPVGVLIGVGVVGLIAYKLLEPFRNSEAARKAKEGK